MSMKTQRLTNSLLRRLYAYAFSIANGVRCKEHAATGVSAPQIAAGACPFSHLGAGHLPRIVDQHRNDARFMNPAVLKFQRQRVVATMAAGYSPQHRRPDAQVFFLGSYTVTALSLPHRKDSATPGDRQ